APQAAPHPGGSPVFKITDRHLAVVVQPLPSGSSTPSVCASAKRRAATVLNHCQARRAKPVPHSGAEHRLQVGEVGHEHDWALGRVAPAVEDQVQEISVTLALRHVSPGVIYD